MDGLHPCFRIVLVLETKFHASLVLESLWLMDFPMINGGSFLEPSAFAVNRYVS